jgi:hypothetical protein
MRQKTTITLTVVASTAIAALAASLVGKHIMTRGRTTDDAELIADVITAETIASAEEFNSAVRRERLILHLDVEWAMQAIQSRPVIVKFKKKLETDAHYGDVVFRRVDCSEPEGPVWDAVAQWLHEQNADPSLMVGGYGAVVWVKSGKVVDSVPYAAGDGVDNLVARTHLVMPNKAVNPSGGSGGL